MHWEEYRSRKLPACELGVTWSQLARKLAACGYEVSAARGSGGAGDQHIANIGRNERLQIAAQRRDLPQQGAAYMRELLMGHEEDRFDFGVHHGVHDRHGEFVFHVTGSPDAAQHDMSADAADEENRQA